MEEGMTTVQTKRTAAALTLPKFGLVVLEMIHGLRITSFVILDFSSFHT